LKPITSRANAAVKAMARLVASAPERRRREVVVLDGTHLLASFLDAGASRGGEAPRVESVMVSRSGLENPEVSRLVARVPQARVTQVADAVFESISTVESATGLLAVVPTPRGRPIPEDADLVLVVEDVQDPGNVGTLIRSAAAAGARHVALSAGCAFAWSLKTVRAGMGAHFSLNLVEDADLEAFLAAYRGTVVALAAGHGSSIYEVDLRGRIAICVGNEGAGLSPAVLARAGVRASIPMPGPVESLNAGVAGSLCLFEAVRQRAARDPTRIPA
jgi:TrmH family RNA methyltransferase